MDVGLSEAACRAPEGRPAVWCPWPFGGRLPLPGTSSLHFSPASTKVFPACLPFWHSDPLHCALWDLQKVRAEPCLGGQITRHPVQFWKWPSYAFSGQFWHICRIHTGYLSRVLGQAAPHFHFLLAPYEHSLAVPFLLPAPSVSLFTYFWAACSPVKTLFTQNTYLLIPEGSKGSNLRTMFAPF